MGSYVYKPSSAAPPSILSWLLQLSLKRDLKGRREEILREFNVHRVVKGISTPWIERTGRTDITQFIWWQLATLTGTAHGLAGTSETGKHTLFLPQQEGQVRVSEGELELMLWRHKPVTKLGFYLLCSQNNFLHPHSITLTEATSIPFNRSYWIHSGEIRWNLENLN